MNDSIASTLAKCLESLDREDLTIEACLERYPQHHAELADLLELASNLEQVHVPRPDEGFEREARARILNTARKSQPVSWMTRLRQSLADFTFTLTSRPIMKLGLVALLLVILGSGVVFASAKAMPGDLLYPVKLFLEDARLNIIGDNKETGLRFDFANERIHEVDMLIQAGKYENISEVIEHYVIQMDQITQAITSQSSEQDADGEKKSETTHSYLEYQLEILYGLLERAPEQAAPGIEKAIEASSKSQELLDELFPDAKPGGGPKDKDSPNQSPIELPQKSDIPSAAVPEKTDKDNRPQSVPEDRGKP